MKTKIIITFFLGLTFPIFSIDLCQLINNLYAQRYPYQNYGNRKEGIVEQRRLVAGEKLVLISAAVENSETIVSNSTPDEYKLGFYLKEPAKLKIEVREFEYFYKMEPVQVNYDRGKTIFSWPSEIPFYYNIGIKDLFPLAKIRQPGKQVLVPVTLFYNEAEILTPVYTFCFVPSASISVLEYRIYNASTAELLFNGELRDLRGEQIFCIRWTGRDNSNNPIESDLLMLVVQANFTRRPGSEIQRVVTVKNEFHHFREYAQLWD